MPLGEVKAILSEKWTAQLQGELSSAILTTSHSCLQPWYWPCFLVIPNESKYVALLTLTRCKGISVIAICTWLGDRSLECLIASSPSQHTCCNTGWWYKSLSCLTCSRGSEGYVIHNRPMLSFIHWSLPLLNMVLLQFSKWLLAASELVGVNWVADAALTWALISAHTHARSCPATS